MRQEHDRKNVVFWNPVDKRPQKSSKNAKNNEIAILANLEIWKQGLNILNDRQLLQVFQKTEKSVFCVFRLGNAVKTHKYWKITQKNSK